jgi:hypothetical protein
MKVRTDIKAGAGPVIILEDEEEFDQDSTQSEPEDFRPW